MNIQTEHLDNHTARLTVAVDAERLDQAKRKAATQLAKRFNIPGFRKGKAPYRIIVNYLGEGAILEDAIETLGQEIYKESLESAQIDPYAPGALEDFKLEEATPVFVFTVPLQPTVELGNYRETRLEYTPPVVEDKDVDAAMKRLQEERALVEESHKPVEIGNRVTLDIHSFIVEPADADVAEVAATEPQDTDDAGEDHEGDDHDHHDHGSEQPFIHEHDAAVVLRDDDDVLLPGFKEALVGAALDDTVSFELAVPDNSDFGDAAGKRARFEVTVKKIEAVTLPVLNDDFAARVTAAEAADETVATEGEAPAEPLTLLQLRIRMREDIQRAEEEQARAEYARKVLDQMVEAATIHYPQEMLDEQIEEMLKELDSNLRRQGVTLEDFMRIMGKSKEQLSAEYEQPAVNLLRRSLTLRELVMQEKLSVSDEDVQGEIVRLAERVGGQVDMIMQMFNSGIMRDNILNNLLQQRVLERIAAIARGEAPELTADEEPAAVPDAPDAIAAAVAEPVAEDTDAAPADAATETDIEEGDAAQL